MKENIRIHRMVNCSRIKEAKGMKKLIFSILVGVSLLFFPQPMAFAEENVVSMFANDKSTNTQLFDVLFEVFKDKENVGYWGTYYTQYQ